MEQKNKIIQIFNLEFPPHIVELKIGDYIFKRVENYKEAFDGMMCIVNSFGSEMNYPAASGRGIQAVGSLSMGLRVPLEPLRKETSQQAVEEYSDSTLK